MAVPLKILSQGLTMDEVRRDASQCGALYTVKPGDTCFQIALDQHIPLPVLEQNNPGKCGPQLQPGQVKKTFSPVYANSYWRV